MTIGEVRRACPHARDTVGVFDGYGGLVFNAYEGTVFVLAEQGENGRVHDRNEITWIRIAGGQFTTAEGVGPGSTVLALRQAYGHAVEYSCDERPLGMRFQARPSWFFVIEDCKPVREAQPGTIADTLRVRGVGLALPEP